MYQFENLTIGFKDNRNRSIGTLTHCYIELLLH